MIERRCRAHLGDGFLFEVTLHVCVGRLLLRSAAGRPRLKQRRVSAVFVCGFEQALANFMIRDLPCQTFGPVGLKPIVPDLRHRSPQCPSRWRRISVKRARQ